MDSSFDYAWIGKHSFALYIMQLTVPGYAKDKLAIYSRIIKYDFEVSMNSQNWFTLPLDTQKLCVKKSLSMDNCFDYLDKKYYPQIVDSTIYKAFV